MNESQDPNTVTLSLSDPETTRARFLGAMLGEAQGAHITFASEELLWKLLTAKRWQLLKTMTGAGAMSIRGLARRLGRDVKAVHRDVHALLDAGVLDKTPAGQIVFPYDTVRVEFVLRAA